MRCTKELAKSGRNEVARRNDTQNGGASGKNEYANGHLKNGTGAGYKNVFISTGTLMETGIKKNASGITLIPDTFDFSLQ